MDKQITYHIDENKLYDDVSHLIEITQKRHYAKLLEQV